MFPHLSCTKLWIWPLSLAVFLNLAACASKKKKAVVSGIPAVASTNNEEAVVKEYDSAQASYSPDGEKIIYISWKRPQHSQPQVYEKVLSTGVERRLTYQNGSTYMPHYHPNEGLILYASDTDELKENPPLLNPTAPPSRLPDAYRHPTEIYLHALNGLEITRLTDRPGFDGEARFTEDGKQIIWTRAQKNRTSIALLNPKNKSVQGVSWLGINPTHYVLSKDRKTFAWIEWDLKYENAKLKIRTAGQRVKEINDQHQVAKTDLNISSDNRYLMWSQLNAIGGNYEIWVYDTQSQCPYMMVSSDAADRRYPVFTPNMKTLTYTLQKEDRSRIVNLPFVPPTGPCSHED